MRCANSPLLLFFPPDLLWPLEVFRRCPLNMSIYYPYIYCLNIAVVWIYGFRLLWRVWAWSRSAVGRRLFSYVKFYAEKLVSSFLRHTSVRTLEQEQMGDGHNYPSCTPTSRDACCESFPAVRTPASNPCFILGRLRGFTSLLRICLAHLTVTPEGRTLGHWLSGVFNSLWVPLP